MRWGKIQLLLACSILLFAFSPELAIAGTLQKIKERGRLIAGVKIDFPPFGFLDEKGRHKGMDVDIARILSRELLGKEDAAELVPVTSADRIPFLQSGKIDVIVASMTITEERKKQIDFSIPYFISGHLVLVSGRSKIVKYQELAGKKVATVEGSTGDHVMEELVPTAKRVKFQNNMEALQALKDGRVDGFVQDDVLIVDLQQKNPHLKIAGFQPFHPAPYGLGVRKGDKEWLDFINATLTKVKKSGEYHELLDKWFGKVRAFLLKLEGF